MFIQLHRQRSPIRAKTDQVCTQVAYCQYCPDSQIRYQSSAPFCGRRLPPNGAQSSWIGAVSRRPAATVWFSVQSVSYYFTHFFVCSCSSASSSAWSCSDTTLSPSSASPHTSLPSTSPICVPFSSSASSPSSPSPSPRQHRQVGFEKHWKQCHWREL